MGNDKSSPVGDVTDLLKSEIINLKKENAKLLKDLTATQTQLQKQEIIEKKFEESQSRFEGIFHQSMLGNKIIATDLKIIQANKALEKMLGYSQKELIGTKITTFSHPDFTHHWQELQASLWEKKIPSFQIETCLIKKDGAGIWCQITSILFQDQGQFLGYTIVENISQRKKLETELKKLYDNQETITHMVAHDLKSPLHNIKLATNFLKENLEESNQSKQEDKNDSLTYVTLISDTSDKALTIINDLITIGELESEYENLEEINLVPFLQAHLNYLFIEAQQKGITIQFKFPAKVAYVRINPVKFMRAMANLLSNAVKFTNRGGQVVVSIKKKKNKTIIGVSDTGIGIPEVLLPTIFQKFTKASRHGTAGEPTTGLGLFIVKQIIEKHQGTIWVESKENVGTTFYIELS